MHNGNKVEYFLVKKKDDQGNGSIHGLRNCSSPKLTKSFSTLWNIKVASSYPLLWWYLSFLLIKLASVADSFLPISPMEASSTSHALRGRIALDVAGTLFAQGLWENRNVWFQEIGSYPIQTITFPSPNHMQTGPIFVFQIQLATQS